jgi:ABC-type multidrug transport system ATPase subunit
MYSYLAYWLTMFLTDVPERLIFTFFVTSAVRAAVGLGGSYLTYHLTCMAVSLAGYGLALLCSWVVNDEVAALAVFSIISSFNVIFCGFLISAPNIDPYLRWLLHVAFTYWGVAQLEYNQFSGLKGMQGDAVLKYYDFEDRSLLPTCLVLMGFFVAFEVATAVCMRPQSKNVEHISMSDPRASELLSVAKSPHVVLPAPVVSEESFRAASDITRESVSKVKVNLKFSNIGYEITSEAKQKQILKGVSGTVDSGEVLAIMGSSGSGKTTLLNVIAGRVNQGRVTGSVTANGAPFLGFRQRNTDMPESQCSVSDFAYVMQDDVHIPCLTVRETLEFAAMLRLRVPQRSDARVQEAVSKVMQMLSLAKIADNLIGSSESRTISSGQLRRLSIGVEIVHDPMLVFLDEPTSGLDSYLASTVVEGMKTLALSGRTLLCAIHQPSAAVFHRFDKLLLLSQGHAIYFGQTSYCRAHFEALGYIFTQTNPADFALAVAHASAQAGLMNASETQPSEQPLYSTEALANLMCDRNESPHCIKETNDVESCGTDTSRTDIVSVEDIPVPFSVDNSGDEGTPSIVIAETDGIWSSALAAEWHDLRLAPVIICVLVKRDLLVILRKKILSRYSIRMFLFGVTLGELYMLLSFLPCFHADFTCSLQG